MDSKVEERLAIFMSAFVKLEDKRKGLLEIEKRIQEDIAECKKRIVAVKSKKKKIPFPNLRYVSPITEEEEPTKEINRRGRRKVTEKAVAPTAANRKTMMKNKLRKRTSDDDLLEEQPLSKMRKEVTVNKATQDKTSMKSAAEAKNTVIEGQSLLEIDVAHEIKEKDNNNSVENNMKNGDLAVINVTVSNFEEVPIKEMPSNEVGSVSEIKKQCGFEKSDDTHKTNSDQIDQSNKIINKEKTVQPSPKNSFIDKTKTFLFQDGLVNNTLKCTEIIKSTTLIKSVPVISKEPVVEFSDRADLNVDEGNKTSKKCGNYKLNKNLSSYKSKSIENLNSINNTKQKSSLLKEAETDFAVPSVPSVNVTKIPTIVYPSSDEDPATVKRFTRSKVPKENKKNVPLSTSDSSSNEESPVKQRFTRSKILKGKENKGVTSSVETTSTSSEEAPVQSRITRSKVARTKEHPKTDLNSSLSSPAEDEKAPVLEVRKTRSKMVVSKKVKTDSIRRSGEKSGASNEVYSSSEGEMGKKKVKDIVKMLNDKQAMVILSPVKLTKEQEKENQHAGILKMIERKEKRTPSVDRRGVVTKTTPLQVRNCYVTPIKKPNPVITSATRNKTAMDDAEKRKKEEEARRKRQKEEEVLRKKQEMLKVKQEEMKKRHEEKMLKAAAMREAAEKEKNDFILKQEKERDERERLAKAESERKKMEEVWKKRLANQTKAAEVETRRLKEEAARLAKLKEMEEEQRQQEELRKKQQEENERILKMRQGELRAKEALKEKALYQKDLQRKQKANISALKDKDNYSITGDLLESEDEGELSEESTKKEYPVWAKKEERLVPSMIQVYYPIHRVMEFFCCPSSPDLNDIFGKMTIKRIRSSSAVWLDSPPLKVCHPVNN